VTTLDLRTIRLRSGEQLRDVRELELAPFQLGGQCYLPVPERPEAALRITQTSSGLVFELDLQSRLVGPCFRCLAEAEVITAVRGREYQATSPGEDEELRTSYIVDDRLDLSSWARDAIALSLPDKILCRADCAGLCPICGKDLNTEPHEHLEEQADPRWAVLAELRDRL
jgi:uncharacterized protein